MEDKEFLQLQSLLDEWKHEDQLDVVSTLKTFSPSNWISWLEDIMNYGIAFPFGNLSPEGDVVVEVVDFMRSNLISIGPYEQAIATFLTQYNDSISNIYFLERLINSLINLKGFKTADILAKLIESRENNYLKGKFDYIKSISLLALARSSSSDNTLMNKVHNYLVLVGFNEMRHSPSFYGNALRFAYLHYSEIVFLNDFERIIRLLSPDYGKNKYYEELGNQYSAVLVDKLDELHYRRVATFYSSVCNWYLGFGEKNGSSDLLSDRLFIAVSLGLSNLLNSKPYLRELYPSELTDFPSLGLTHDSLAELEYGKCLRFLLNILHERENFEISVKEAATCTAFLIEQEGERATSFLVKSMVGKMAFVNHHLRIIPFTCFNDLSGSFEYETILRVMDFYERLFVTDYFPVNASEIATGEALSKPRKTSSDDFLRINTKQFLNSFGKDHFAVGQQLVRQYEGAS